jgi:Na/Pi-cotransporter
MSSSTWEFLHNIFVILGGLGLFLYGMKMMSEGLENIAGNRMRTILEKATSNRFVGIIIGALVTCIIQSSSATTVMLVSFVNASLLTITQAIGVIMGANIGTTITAQMISLNVEELAPLIIFIGVFMNLVFKKRSIKNIGYILLGFGILFFGISVMGSPLKELAQTDWFQSTLITFKNPVLALLVGLILTSIIQSSSATTGMVVTLYLSGVDLPFKTAAFIVLGSHIGTCITAVLASLPASRESKRVAMAHVLFNVFGTAFWCLLLFIFPSILTWIQNSWSGGARQIAMFHTISAVSTVIILVPFVKQIARIVKKLIPELPDENLNVKKLIYLDQSVLQMPAVAVSQVHLEFCRMGKITSDNLNLAVESFFEKDLIKAEKVLETEELINYLNHQMITWLVKIQDLNLSASDKLKISTMFRTSSDIERIGNHAENIAEYTILVEKYNADISPEALKELKKLSDVITQIMDKSLIIFEKNDFDSLDEVILLEQETDSLAKEAVENHIRRLKKKKCDPRGGVIFTDMVSDLERCADHANNIAHSLGNGSLNLKSKKIARKIPKTKTISKKVVDC